MFCYGINDFIKRETALYSSRGNPNKTIIINYVIQIISYRWKMGAFGNSMFAERR